MDLLNMASVAGQMHRGDIVEGWIVKFRKATYVPDDRSLKDLMTQSQLADIEEDRRETLYWTNPSPKTWQHLKAAKLHAIAMEYQVIAAGDRRYS